MELCDAILEFEEKRFVCCDLEEGHIGNHKALMFTWSGKGRTKTDDSDWFRGWNLLKMKMQEGLTRLS